MFYSRKWILPLLLLAMPLHAQESEWDKITYEVQTDVVASQGKHAPFWLVSNRHGLSSLANNSASLSAGIQRDFDAKRGFTWAYGAEMAGAWNYSSPFYIQQLYADIKYNCWELSIGSKERWSEGKHRTLSGGGLTFAPNARPIPQVRIGINEYTTLPQWFNDWVQVKGHMSYGWQTDNAFIRDWMQEAIAKSCYAQNVLFHEKTAFVRIANPNGKGLVVEGGLEMYAQFGGQVYKKDMDGNYYLHRGLPATYKEYIKAFIPMAGGEDSPTSEQTNINGNVLGSWHLIVNYKSENWQIRAYYEHFYEDHSQMLGVSWVPDRNGNKRFLSYHPWQDGMWGMELNLHKGRWIKGVVAEFITSRDQSGPILHNTNNVFKEQISGWDSYYTHYLYQSWQHWGMGMANPQFLAPSYNDDHSMSIPNTRLRSYHVGIEGKSHTAWSYRILASHTRHWGSITDPLPKPMLVTCLMVESTYNPTQSAEQGWEVTTTLAYDHSKLIGNNLGGMLTLRKYGILKK